MPEKEIEVRGHEARQILDSQVFRAALEAAFRWGDEGLEKAEDEEAAWLALQRRRATRQAVAFLVIAVRQGDAIAVKTARYKKKLDDEGETARQDLLKYLSDAKEAREVYDDKRGGSE